MENFHYCCVSERVTWCGIVNVTVLVKIDQNVRAGSLIYTSFLGGLSLNHLYSIAHDNLRLAIWDTSFWTFLVKFGHKGP